MTKTAERIKKLGIGGKTSIICGINVLVLLTVGTYMLLKFEYSLKNFFVDEYVQKMECTIEEQGAKQRKSLDSRYKVNAEIAAGIAAPFVFNLDNQGIKLALERYMEIDEMLALQVIDVDGTRFFAMWKISDRVSTGESIPETVNLKQVFSSKADSYVRSEKVGYVEVFYTDALLADQIATSREKAKKEIEDFRTVIDQRIDRVFITQVFGVLCVILVLIASIVASLNFIVLKPVNKCLQFAQRMSKGNFSERLEVERKDEIATLVGALNQMSFNLGNVLAEISKGMRSLAGASTELLTTAEDLSTGSEELTVQASTAASATEKIKNNIHVVTKTAETMSIQSQNVASSAKEMSSNVTSVAASIEEMSASIYEVAEHCSQAQVIAENARGASHDAEMKMTELNQAAQGIGKIIDVITSITEQTKLLALNASIEAAASGDAGKGFAVVANEVKNLAQQTAEATQDIAQQVEDIQKKTSTVVADIQKVATVNSEVKDHTNIIAAAVEKQTATASEIARIVGGVAQNSSNVSNLVENFSKSIELEVVAALKEANSGVAKVSTNNQWVNTVAQESDQSAGRINAAAKKLSELANELQEQIGQFKTS